MSTDLDAASEAELRRRKAFESTYVSFASLLNPDGTVNDEAIEELGRAVNARWGITDLSETATEADDQHDERSQSDGK